MGVELNVERERGEGERERGRERGGGVIESTSFRQHC